MTNLSTQNYKGTRDYYPEDKRVQNYVFSKWRKTAEQFGYEEYGAPLLESVDVYAAKSGQELVNEQSYAFYDRGGRQMMIRPEMTPSISRMVAARRQEMGYPARLYSIANFMRYERPQRGREREFWQLNVDIFGVENIKADAEIIEFSYASMMNLHATESMFKIRINHRTLVNILMSRFLELDAVGANMMVKLLDRKNKIPAEVFRDQAAEIFGDRASVGLQKLAQLISLKSIDDLPEVVAGEPSVKELTELFALLKQKNITNAVFDVTLMRGLDYYTGIVFEFFDESPENKRSLFGGGRYDGLVGLFGAEPIATVGAGLGATTLEQFLVTHELLPDLPTHTDVYIASVGDTVYAGVDALAKELRQEGVKVAVDLTDRKLDKQLKTAQKKGITYVVIVGEDEIKTGLYTVKNLTTSEETKTEIPRIISMVSDRRLNGDDDLEFSF